MSFYIVEQSNVTWNPTSGYNGAVGGCLPDSVIAGSNNRKHCLAWTPRGQEGVRLQADHLLCSPLHILWNGDPSGAPPWLSQPPVSLLVFLKPNRASRNAKWVLDPLSIDCPDYNKPCFTVTLWVTSQNWAHGLLLTFWKHETLASVAVSPPRLEHGSSTFSLKQNGIS